MGTQELCLCQGSAMEQPWCGFMPGKDRVVPRGLALLVCPHGSVAVSHWGPGALQGPSHCLGTG